MGRFLVGGIRSLFIFGGVFVCFLIWGIFRGGLDYLYRSLSMRFWLEGSRRGGYLFGFKGKWLVVYLLCVGFEKREEVELGFSL